MVVVVRQEAERRGQDQPPAVAQQSGRPSDHHRGLAQMLDYLAQYDIVECARRCLEAECIGLDKSDPVAHLGFFLVFQVVGEGYRLGIDVYPGYLKSAARQ